ncbi:GYD domain-containing protein [Thioclava sp. JE_KL1]|uniref:GYD domain-containing protein n=1 Tax=Thioclava sp. JE_KL1 TaxID=2651187 RepID=UPI00128E500B|nr:GYD domain-containing protein [Thioclava sp. JE_KL1]MPQ92744.1 GYD domain-containing protein [Thioclava sp. JE_KL1]
MGRFVITGSFSPQALKGFMDSPTDRWGTIDALIKAAGGKMETYYITTGPSDFLIIATVDDVKKVLPAIMVAAGSGAVSKVQTQEAFTTADFKEMQEAAAGIRSNFVPPGS